MAKQDTAKYNEDIDETCHCCKEANSIANHIRWQCKYFNEHRKKQDPELAAVPFKYLLHCIQCGIAPAMNVVGERSYRERISTRTPMKR